MPKRIQLSRARGWRLPAGAIHVARPTKWGNPFRVDAIGHELALTLFGEAVHGFWSPSLLTHLSDDEFSDCYDRFVRWRERLGGHPRERAIAELRGHDLACWCRLGQPCHADTWLRVANA